MQDQDTISILVSQLLSKDDEILRLRSQLDRLQKEQQSGTSQILEKLDRTLMELDRSFEELKNMRKDNKRLANQLSKALQEKSDSDKKSELFSRALEELKNVRASELFELEKQKRKLYGRKSEKKSVLGKDEDNNLKKDKDDFDGSALGSDPFVEFSCCDSKTEMPIAPHIPLNSNPVLIAVITANVLLPWSML